MGFNKVNALLVAINTVTVIVGILVTICGVLGIMKQADINDYSGGYSIELICYGVLITGVIIIIVGLIGWYAGYSGNATIAKTYAFLIILITLLQLAFCVTEYLQRDGIADEVENYMNATFNGTAYADLSEVSQEAVDLIQTSLECCGLVSSADWAGPLPLSCCGHNNATIGCTAAAAYVPGCRAKAQSFVTTGIMTSVIILAIGFVLEIICIVAGCYIVRASSGDYGKVKG